MNHQPTSLKPAEYGRTVYSHAVEKGNDYEKDVLKPAYWAHVANKLKAGDRIEVLGPEGGYFAELYVANVLSQAVVVIELVKVQLEAGAPEIDDDDFEVKFRGPQKWSIVRKADSKVIQEMIQTRADANRELADYKKVLAA
jgi:hypothetical protein